MGEEGIAPKSILSFLASSVDLTNGKGSYDAQSPKVHIYTSSPDAFFVNSFIIEGERSLILVDSQFVLSEAHALAEAMIV